MRSVLPPCCPPLSREISSRTRAVRDAASQNDDPLNVGVSRIPTARKHVTAIKSNNEPALASVKTCKHDRPSKEDDEMPRYLTPARLCFLVLIRLYQSGHCTSTSTLDLLDFIARHVGITGEHDQETIHERRTLFASDIAALRSKLQQWPSRFPGRNVYDLLLHTIWKLTSLDSLHKLLQQMKYLLVPGGDPEDPDHNVRPITPASPLGQFVRRCYVEFTRLRFSDSQALWNAFAAYRGVTFEEYAAKNPDRAVALQQEAASNVLAASPIGPSLSQGERETASASSVDAGVLLGYAIHQLQKVGQRVPPDVKASLENWVGDEWDSGTQSLHFFMAFFEHWRAGQYTMALESLHRYFDYSLSTKSGSDNMRIYYQYALLHLSVLHADFECWEESVDAMNECIATARENQDTTCLNFALSWLLYLRHAHPGKSAAEYGSVSGVVGSNGGEHDEIAFLKQKAREGKHWMLMTSALLEEGRTEVSAGGSTTRAQEHALQAMYLVVQHDLRTVAPAVFLFHGACLERLGQSHLAARMYEVADVVHSTNCPLNERVRAVCRLALTLAQAGHFAKALALLDDLSPVGRGLLKSEQRVKSFAALIHLRRQIHRGNHEAAKYYISQLQPIRSLTDPETALEFDILEVESLLKRKEYEAALQKVSARLAETKSRTDIAQRLYFLLLKSRVFAAAGQPSKGFAIALRATSTAERHLLMPVLLEGLAVLSRILIDLSEFEMARDILESTIPHALESCNISLTARLFVTIGEASVGIAGHKFAENASEQTRCMRRAMELIEKGRIAYQKTEDLAGQLDCLVMKSRIASWDGDETTRELADEMHLQLLVDSKKEQDD